jgi:NAD+ synthase (glutamine-hydrolysing)
VRLALAQLNLHVGAIDANADKVVAAARRARDELNCSVVLFPELTLSGYPPEDLLLHRGMRHRIAKALTRVTEAVSGITLMLGYPEYAGEQLYNAASLFRDGARIAHYRKHSLPNYAVFDEKRYFSPGVQVTLADLEGKAFGLTICEDLWDEAPSRQLAAAGADAILCINGSPYRIDKQRTREAVLRERARAAGVPVVYVNMVGGQDELVFDGGSFVMDGEGEVRFRAPPFMEDIYAVELATSGAVVQVAAGPVAAEQPLEDSVYQALILGTRDYVNKNGFSGVVLGLSGGIDSALTLAIAVDALGADRVHAVMMPSRFTSDISLADAAEQAESLGVRYDVLSIETMFAATLDVLGDLFAGLPADTTEENIQSRCRGVLLMAISNKLGSMLLTTGNKSEMAVGYATLYGDMAGGFAPLKDCSKTLVYQLARYRNRRDAVIPRRVIERPPSAELAPDQKDTDSLPPYDILDPILEAFIERDYTVDQIVELGFDRATVGRILRQVQRNEYKRRQAPPGVRVSSRAFGRDWRYPITSGYAGSRDVQG